MQNRNPPENIDDDPGPGRGYIDIYNTNGTLERRFASEGGTLNSPWGIEDLEGGRILIGNFGDGKINVFDENGTFLVQMKNTNGQPISIEGLWAITFSSSNSKKLYFTAGPDDEEHGVFGYLMLK